MRRWLIIALLVCVLGVLIWFLLRPGSSTVRLVVYDPALAVVSGRFDDLAPALRELPFVKWKEDFQKPQTWESARLLFTRASESRLKVYDTENNFRTRSFGPGVSWYYYSAIWVKLDSVEYIFTQGAPRAIALKDVNYNLMPAVFKKEDAIWKRDYPAEHLRLGNLVGTTPPLLLKRRLSEKPDKWWTEDLD